MSADPASIIVPGNPPIDGYWVPRETFEGLRARPTADEMARAVEAETERCAKIADEYKYPLIADPNGEGMAISNAATIAAHNIAAAIRARKDTNA